MALINQFSAFTLFILPIGAFIASLVWRQNPVASRSALVFGIVTAVLLGYFILLRQEPKSTSSGEVERLLNTATGRPLLLELYSNY